MYRTHLFWGLIALVLVNATAQADEEARARQLLQRAVEYYQVQGDAAFAAFSRQGEFIDGEHYVFVVDTQGTMLASGGTSAVLIGRDVSQALEPELRDGFRQALAGGEGELRQTEYRWMNARDARVERKRVFFQRVGDRVIAVGLYLPRATPQQAEQLLERTAQALAQDPEASIAAINGLSPRFREDDLYAFVIDLRSGRYVAHGYNLRLLGVPFASIHDPDGKPVGAPILALMKTRDQGGYDYRWKNPVTGKVEDKYALLRKAGDFLVAVGYYKKTE
ncbi:MAG: cache domain-containing protein [Gammaproteobacteria bacterium]|nr:cache domain-containing protein [Gammaproteobacteria bacterium]MBU2138560.1 cache domain-containing protein [Gammaproteobacteria bacterium]MBU2323132.1 cache domain-containing protein [Gammaproteobacteria bacterium]